MRGEAQDRRATDDGTTLIEVLVAMGLFAVVGSLLLGLALSTRDVTQDVRANTGVDEEARTAMERMTRELRQATSIEDVHLATTSEDYVSVRFWTDFDGNGLRSSDAANPEVMTYRWDRSTGKLSLSALGGGPSKPLLAANVTEFEIGLESSDWEYDQGSGVDSEAVAGERIDSVTWRELDSTIGNGNNLPDGLELGHIDLVTVAMTVQDDSGTQTYGTQIDLRNGG